MKRNTKQLYNTFFLNEFDLITFNGHLALVHYNYNRNFEVFIYIKMCSASDL